MICYVCVFCKFAFARNIIMVNGNNNNSQSNNTTNLEHYALFHVVCLLKQSLKKNTKKIGDFSSCLLLSLSLFSFFLQERKSSSISFLAEWLTAKKWRRKECSYGLQQLKELLVVFTTYYNYHRTLSENCLKFSFNSNDHL